MVTTVRSGGGSVGSVLALALVVGACTTTSGIRANALGGLKAPTDDDAVYVRGESGGMLRVDPNTNIRFKRSDGTYTEWIRARHLHANDNGVFRVHRMALRNASRGEVRGLDADLVSVLERAMPRGCRQHVSGDVIRLAGPPGCVAAWLVRYLDARGRASFVSTRWGKDEGRWSFELVPLVWTQPIDGHGLSAALDDGLDVHIGLAFSDIAGAEVKNFSGSKSLALVVGSAAVIAAIVAIAKDTPSGWGIHATANVAEVVVRSAIYASACADVCRERKRALPVDALPSPALDSPSAMAARPLFTGMARRRSDLKIIASAEAGYDFAYDPGFSQTAAVTARIRDFIELGGGARHIANRDDITGRYIAFGRIGGSFFLDDEHRIAAVILGDLGAGSQVWQTKLNLGFRVLVTEGLSGGVFLFSPTYTVRNFARDQHSSWAFPSALEISYAF